MGKFSNYSEYIEQGAQEFVDEYEDDLIQEIKDGNTDIHEYVNDSRTHEWVDNDFIYVDLVDSAEILEQSDNVETDYGLWEGLEPRKAIEAQAFFTYRNDLSYAVMDKIEELLQTKLDDVMSNLEELREELESEENEDIINELKNEIEEHESLEEYLGEAIDSI